MSDTADWLTAIATVGATVVSIASAFMAARSASASKASAEVAARILHRSAMRELIAECHELIAEEMRIQSLSIDLESEYRSLAVFTNNLGSGRDKTYREVLAKDRASAAEKTREARSLVEDQTRLAGAADQDLDLMQGQIEAAKAELQTIRESMARQLENLRSQNQQYRERAIQ